MPVRKPNRRVSTPKRPARVRPVHAAGLAREPAAPEVLNEPVPNGDLPEPPPAPPEWVWVRLGDTLYSHPAPREHHAYEIQVNGVTHHHVGENHDGRWIYARMRG